MTLEPVQVNFKARDDAALGRFWAQTLGWRVPSEGPGVTDLEPVGCDWRHPSAVCVDPVGAPDPGPGTVRYRVHLELGVSARRGPTWVRVTCPGWSWPTPWATSSAPSGGADAAPPRAARGLRID